MNTLNAILLVLLAVVLTPLVQAQITASFTFTNIREVPDRNDSGMSDVNLAKFVATPGTPLSRRSGQGHHLCAINP